MSTKLGDSFINEQAVNFLTRDGWQNWTPTVTQGVGVTFNTVYARYMVSGNLAVVQVYLVITSNGTAGQVISIGGQSSAIQVANLALLATIGNGIIVDQSAAWYSGILVTAGATDWRMVRAAPTATFIGADPNFGLVNGDLIIFNAAYER